MSDTIIECSTGSFTTMKCAIIIRLRKCYNHKEAHGVSKSLRDTGSFTTQFLDQDGSPPDIFDLDLSPPDILDKDVSPLDNWHPGCFACGLFGPGCFACGLFGSGRFTP